MALHNNYGLVHHQTTIGIYAECKGNVAEAKRKLAESDLFPTKGPSISYIRRIWKENELKIAPNGGRRVAKKSYARSEKRTSFNDLELLNVLADFYFFVTKLRLTFFQNLDRISL